MLTYENLWFDPTDDSKNGKQLKDAKEIVSRYVLLNDRYKKLVNIKQEIIDCICKNIYLEDEEFEKELAKNDAQIVVVAHIPLIHSGAQPQQKKSRIKVGDRRCCQRQPST